MGRNRLSVTTDLRMMSGMVKICSWGHTGSCDTLSSSDLGFVLDFASVDLPPPLYGHAEELSHTGGLGARRRSEIALGQWNDAHDLIGLDPSCQDADAIVFNDPHGAKGDFYLLFTKSRQQGAILVVNGGVDDSEPNFRPRGV